MKAWIFLAGLSAATAPAGAQGWPPDAAFAQAGAGDRTSSLSVGLQWTWGSEWRIGRELVLSRRWELGLGRWRAEFSGDGSSWAWTTQLSAVPALRLSREERRGLYAEVGIGPSLLLPIYRSSDRRFTTKLNFQDHVAAGFVWGDQGTHDLGLRFDHYSNGGIRKPNPGVELASIRYTHRF